MNSKQSGRRRFLKKGAALAGLAVGANAGSIQFASGQTVAPEIYGVSPKDNRSYSQPSRFETLSRWPIRPKDVPPGYPAHQIFAPSRTPLQDLTGIITPSGLHYYVDGSSAYPLQDIDPRQHRLLIHGMVDRPLILTLGELKLLPSVSRIHWLECMGNSGLRERNFMQFHETAQMIAGATSCAEWTGVPLSLLLKEAGVQKEASWIIAEGADHEKRAKSFQLEKAMDDVIVAYAQNGEAPRPENGYPLRLVVPGWAGHNSVKWLRRIKVTDRPYMAKDDLSLSVGPDGKWIGEREYNPKSIITFPSGGQTLPGRGLYEISGLAWTGGGVIRRVEVTTDGGKTWKDAQLQEPVLPKAHTRFRLAWNWDGEETVIDARCSDERNRVQPTIAEIRKKWGDNPDRWRPISEYPGARFDGSQPWKVTREGSVHNAAYGPHMTPPPAPGTPADTALNLNSGGKDQSCLS